MVLTGMREAAAPGDVRATTERLTAEDGEWQHDRERLPRQ